MLFQYVAYVSFQKLLVVITKVRKLVIEGFSKIEHDIKRVFLSVYFFNQVTV